MALCYTKAVNLIQKEITMIPVIPKIENKEKYADFDLPREKLEYALSEAIKKIDFALPMFTDKFPEHASTNNVYPAVDNDSGWNTGFWSGILLHAYEMTGNEKYKDVVVKHHIPTFLNRMVKKLGIETHDMGFLYSLSCVAAYKLTGDETAREAALLAAKNLCTRYQPVGKFIQAWGKMGAADNYRLIVDCLMNVPLLHWATETTGDPMYREIALNHFNTTIELCCRPDASTYHTYYFDMETGEPTKGVTAQGASNDSAWARGQTWCIYGPMLTYVYEKNEKALELVKATTNYFLNHMPEDYIAFWDLSFTDGDDEPRDSSSNPIAICGMLEAVKYMDESDPLRKIYINACKRMMNSLIDNYLTKDVPEANGLLLHATYGKPQNNGVDEMNIWGDYFYMEALNRMLNPDWKLYW